MRKGCALGRGRAADVTEFFTALALAIVIEGVAYAAFPRAMKKMLLHVLAQPTSHVRAAGLVAAAAGVIALWLIRG